MKYEYSAIEALNECDLVIAQMANRYDRKYWKIYKRSFERLAEMMTAEEAADIRKVDPADVVRRYSDTHNGSLAQSTPLNAGCIRANTKGHWYQAQSSTFQSRMKR